MTHHIDNRQFGHRQTRRVIDVVDHCRRNGLDKAQERRLLLLFGRFASRHELAMNTKRPPHTPR